MFTSEALEQGELPNPSITCRRLRQLGKKTPRTILLQTNPKALPILAPATSMKKITFQVGSWELSDPVTLHIAYTRAAYLDGRCKQGTVSECLSDLHCKGLQPLLRLILEEAFRGTNFK